MNQDTRICTFCLCSLLEPMVIPIYIELENEPKVNDQHIEGICIKSTSWFVYRDRLWYSNRRKNDESSIENEEVGDLPPQFDPNGMQFESMLIFPIEYEIMYADELIDKLEALGEGMSASKTFANPFRWCNIEWWGSQWRRICQWGQIRIGLLLPTNPL